MAYALTASGIGKSFGGVEVLRGLNFHAANNEIVSFVGPSGCGKSTLFNIITGLLEPDAGRIHIGQIDTTGVTSAAVGYVLQKDLLFPWRTVLENVLLGLEIRGADKRAARAKAHELLKLYRMDGYENALPSQLSGGMRQRVALMRTMITDPEIILMDESYKALDYPLKIALEGELLETIRREKKTVIFITHDIEEAVTLSDRVYVMKAHPGEIVDEIAIDLETESTLIPERRLSPKFNGYYELIWRKIGLPSIAA